MSMDVTDLAVSLWMRRLWMVVVVFVRTVRMLGMMAGVLPAPRAPARCRRSG